MNWWNVVTRCALTVLAHGLASSCEADACQRGVMDREFFKESSH